MLCVWTAGQQHEAHLALCFEKRLQVDNLCHDAADAPHVHGSGVVAHAQQQLGGPVVQGDNLQQQHQHKLPAAMQKQAAMHAQQFAAIGKSSCRPTLPVYGWSVGRYWRASPKSASLMVLFAMLMSTFSGCTHTGSRA